MCAVMLACHTGTFGKNDAQQQQQYSSVDAPHQVCLLFYEMSLFFHFIPRTGCVPMRCVDTNDCNKVCRMLYIDEWHQFHT